jgi:hypothetical protein
MSQVKNAAPARMKPAASMPSVNRVSYGTLNVDGLSIAYREAGRPESPSWFSCTAFRRVRINTVTWFLPWPTGSTSLLRTIRASV